VATFHIDQAGMDRLRDAAAHTLARIGEEIAEDMRRAAPVDTGRLKDSIEVDQVERGQGFTARIKIWARTPYAVFVELGTRPHIIRVKNASVLADVEEGKFFGPIVHHPGTKPNPFMRSSLYRKRSG